MNETQINQVVDEAAYGEEALTFVQVSRLKHGTVYGPTQDDAAAWATYKARVRTLEINKTRWVPYIGDNAEMRTAIRSTILKLPYEAQNVAFQSCVFDSNPPTVGGMTWHPRRWSNAKNPLAQRALILIMEMTPPAEWETVIAHEIAHVFLGHPHRDEQFDGQFEVETDELLTHWGIAAKIFVSTVVELAAEWEARVTRKHAQDLALGQTAIKAAIGGTVNGRNYHTISPRNISSRTVGNRR